LKQEGGGYKVFCENNLLYKTGKSMEHPMKCRNNLAATVAAVALLSCGAFSVSAETYTDSAGTSINVGDRSAARSVRSGVNSGGVSGSDITVVPGIVKEIYRDLRPLFDADESEIETVCDVNAKTSTYWTGPPSLDSSTYITSHSGTRQFGSREYIRNDGSYLQFKGRSSSHGSRIYKTPQANPLTMNYVSSRWTRVRLTFNRFEGYGLKFQTANANAAGYENTNFFNGEKKPNLSEFVGQTHYFATVSPFAINHPVVGHPTVSYSPSTPAGANGYSYLYTYRNSGNRFTYHVGINHKAPGRSLQHRIKVDEITHIKDAAGNYTSWVKVKFQNVMMGNYPFNYPFYAGLTNVSKNVLRLNDAASGNCGGYGCWYDDFTVMSRKPVYVSEANSTAAIPFQHEVLCQFL
jgi:hypothetical protein